MAYLEGMITSKEAVNSAAQYFREISFAEPEGLRVEEVNLSDSHDRWLVTLGFLGDDLPKEPTDLFFRSGSSKKREYKLFRVNTKDGSVDAMEIRSVK